MKVLILTGRFGMGHVSAARALEEQILADYRHVSVEVVDLLEYTMPRFSGWIYKAFGFLTQHGRSLYNFVYRQAGKRDENEWTAFTALSMKRLTELMRDREPQVVLSTLPLCSLLVSKYKERAWKDAEMETDKKAVTLATCITDISSHSEWIQPHTDFYLVGDEFVKRQLISKGVEGDRVIVTGIPVGKAFVQEEDIGKEEETRGLQKEEQEMVKEAGRQAGEKQKRLLIMGGGLGLLPGNRDFYDELDAMPGVRTTVITGRNEKLYGMLCGQYKNIEAVGYTDQVATYMKRADVVLTKPGGITLFETIFSGKPVLIFPPFLQQEVNNMHFALFYNIGRALPKQRKEWRREIGKMMADEKTLRSMAANVKGLRNQYERDGLKTVLRQGGF